MSEEIWKDIPEFNGFYQASNMGRIKSLERIDALGRRVKERILKPSRDCYGYYRIQLWKQSIGKAYQVHRLVWSAFNGPIPEGMQVNHIDENPSNNSLSNLNLMTPKENCNWGTRNERAGKVLKNRKDLSKPVLQFTLDDILIKEYPSTKQVERETGFNSSNILSCCNGKRKTAHGFKWKYKE